MRKYQIPQVHDDQKLKNMRQVIQRKVEEYEDISKKIHNDSETIKQLILKMKSLNKEINDSNVYKQERELEVESRFEEIQRMKNELNDSTSTNEIFELLDDIEDLHEDIEKWTERFQNLEKTVRSWMQKNSDFEDTVTKIEDDMSLRDQKASDIEDHITFLNLMFETKKKMADHKEKIARCRNSNNLRNQQKEKLLIHLWTHLQKRTMIISAFNQTKEEFEHTKGRNIDFDNMNIKYWTEHIELNVSNIEELRRRTEKDRNEISESERRLKAWHAEIEEICKPISCPEMKNFKKEHMIELNYLSTKLDEWNTEYERFEAEHDQWLKKKNQLEEKVRTVQHETDQLDKQTTRIADYMVCLNMTIDTDEKMMKLRKMMAELIDLEKQKKDTDNMWEDYEKKIGEDKRNAHRLDLIKKYLLHIESPEEDKTKTDVLDFILQELWRIENLYDNLQIQQEWKTPRPQKNTSNRQQMIHGQALWSELLILISSDAFRIGDFLNKSNQAMKALEFRFELMGPSNSAISDEKERIELLAAQIEEKYEEVKQQNDLRRDDNTAQIKEYLHKIKLIFEEINSCESRIREIRSSWETEKDMLEKNSKVLAKEIESQNRFNDKIAKRVNSIHFMFDPVWWMAPHSEKTMKNENQAKEADTRWNTFMNEYGRKFNRLSKNKAELIETLNTNWKYIYRREEAKQQHDYIEEEGGRKEIVPKEVEEMFKTISQLSETFDKLNEERTTLIIPLAGEVGTRYEQVIRPLNPTKEDIEMRFEEIDHIREKILRCTELMESEEEKFQNWEVKIKNIEEQAKVLALNPFNIQIGGFHQVKNECLSMMGQQEAKTRDHEIKWSNYLRDNKENIDKFDKLNKLIHLMPHDAIKLFQEIQDNAQDATKLSDINKRIEHCHKEANTINHRIKDLRKRMSDIELMTDDPHIFAVDLMTPENITHIFSEIGKWNKMYKSLKETIDHWENN